MKTFFMKAFLMFSAMACMFQGMMLLSVGLGRLSPEKLINLYEQLLNLPAALKTIEGVGAFFVLLGFILLGFAARTKHTPKMITIEQEGQSLNIDYTTIIDFIEEVGSQDPYVTHFVADFVYDRKEGITIPIEIELNGVPSVHHVLVEMEKTLREEIINVFGLKELKFDFHVKGVSIDPKKKYFASHAAQTINDSHPEASEVSHLVKDSSPNGATMMKEEVPVVQEVIVPKYEKSKVLHINKTASHMESDIALEEKFAEKRSDGEIEQLFEESKKDSKKSSLVSRILWGK